MSNTNMNTLPSGEGLEIAEYSAAFRQAAGRIAVEGAQATGEKSIFNSTI
jgi:hypothetical protein